MVVSLDIFDTALLRNVYQPTDIFKLVEQDVCRDFYGKRKEAENKAREVNFYYDIYDIYKFLPEFDVEVEIKTELENCKANPRILELYKQNPSNYIFISDMYLPSTILKQMLERIGYENPQVFVSCEMKALKGDGGLFRKVQSLGYSIEKHYGDNYVADIEGARKAGIPDVEFHPALHNIKVQLPVIRDVRLKKYIAEVLTGSRTKEDKIALLFSPLVVGFTKWVLRQRKPGQKIFFLSRDMITPYVVAKKILKAPDVYYLHASRRSLGSACLKSGDRKLINKMRLILTEQEMRDFQKRDTKEILTYLNKFNIKEGDLIVDIGYSGTIQAALDSVLKVKTKGLYLQVFPETLFDVDAVEYLRRRVISYCLMLEIPLGSAEDCVEDYKNGEVIYRPEHEKRKALARQMTKTVVEGAQEIINWPISIIDIEQLLIHVQYYLNDELLSVFNQPIYSNRDIGESVINFDKGRIMKGDLRAMAQRSYSYKLFKQMLEADPELAHLSSLI